MTPARLLVLWAVLSVPAAIAVAALLHACRQRTIGEEAEAFLRTQLGERAPRGAGRRTGVVVAVLAALAIVSYRAAGDLPRQLVAVATAHDVSSAAHDDADSPPTTTARTHHGHDAGVADHTTSTTAASGDTESAAAGSADTGAAATASGDTPTVTGLDGTQSSTTVAPVVERGTHRTTTTSTTAAPFPDSAAHGTRPTTTTTTSPPPPAEETTSTSTTSTSTTEPPEETTTTTTTAPPEPSSSPEPGTTTTTTEAPPADS